MTHQELVLRTRELENALGNGIKKIENNELETCVVQRRSICSNKDLRAGDLLTKDNLQVLRPCPSDGIPPYMIDEVVDKELKHDLKKGQHISWTDLK